MREVPIWEKIAMTFEEAASYSSIGINKLRQLADEPNCDFVLHIGSRKLIKRTRFDKFINDAYSI